MLEQPVEPFDMRVYRSLQKRCRRTAGQYFPLEVGSKMLIKPLDLGPRMQHVALPMLAVLAR
ncbi:MAG TPA: hypothetical protein VNF46_07305 [Gammaproteobacteria bacterium]|nr:hypothetical protein [Gammaproteobacteria bacterium]